MRAQYSPVDGDGHHVHQGGRHVAVEEEGEDPAQSRAQGPGLVNISRQQILYLDSKYTLVIILKVSLGQILQSFNLLP